MTPRQLPELRRAVRRLTLQFTGLMLVIVLLLGAAIFAIVSQSAAEASTKALFDATHIDSPRDAPVGIWVAVQRGDSIQTSREQIAGLPDVGAFEQAARSMKPVHTMVTSGERTFDVLTVVGEGGAVQAARDLHETREELTRLFWALVIAGAIAAVCSAVGSAWMARRAIQPLATALELQRRFVTDASHELRTPLTVLSTRAQLARRHLAGRANSAEDAATLEDLNHVVEDARKLTGILEDLLIAADTRSTAPQTIVDVAAAARAAITATEVNARERSVRIRADAIQSGATVVAAEAGMERLFIALLDNAIDHARSEVAVEVAVVGKAVIARVRDDGPGFAAGTEDQAFERFATSRVSPSTSDASASPRHYGIGLALVAEIAGRAGGSVRIEETAGRTGASILVELPHRS